MTDYKKSYQNYLKNPRWKKTRSRILERANGVCENKGCSSTATQVHHKTYKRLGRERNSDLQALCGPCHAKKHPDKAKVHFRKKRTSSQNKGDYFIGELDCVLCPGEVAEFFVGNKKECRTLCLSCGHNSSILLPKPKKRRKKKKKKKEKSVRRRAPKLLTHTKF
jgi:hypothetical protein